MKTHTFNNQKNLKKLFIGFLFLLFSMGLHAQNYALEFDGSNPDYVDLGNPATLNFDSDADAISVSAWFRINSGDNGMIVCKSKNPGASEQQFSIGYSAHDLVFGTVGGTRIDGSQQHDDGEWHHACLTSDGSNFYLYIDGIQEASGTPGSYDNSTLHWLIGTRKDESTTSGYDFSLTGDVDEVKIWDKKLSVSEVRADMSNELASPSTETNLLAYYSMSDGSGTTLSDDKGSLDGTISGASWLDPATSPIGDASIFSLGDSDITEDTEVSIDVTLSNEGTNYSYSAIQYNQAPSVTTGMENHANRYWELWANNINFDGDFSATVNFHYDGTGVTDEQAIKLFKRDKTGDSWTLVSSTLHDEGDNTDGNGYLSISIDETNGFDDQYIIGNQTDNTPFPIELGEITYQRKENRVNLNWFTYSETNNDYFEIRRSNDGEDFTSVGMISGNGTTSEINEYAFKDRNIQADQDYYYRLKQTDFDGQSTKSDVIYVPAGKDLDVTVFPTVANDKINFAINKAAEIHIYSMQGALVKQVRIDGSAQLNISDLRSGMYFYHVTTAFESFSGKFAKE